MPSMQAGDLRDRITFGKFGTADGEAGNFRGGVPVEQMTLWANIIPINGGEEVMAGRLQGRRTFLVTVRQSSDSAKITNNWLAQDRRVSANEWFNIREVKPKDNGRAFFEILCESGVGP